MTDINPTPEEAAALQLRDTIESMKGVSTHYLTVVIEGREIPGLMMMDRGEMISLQLDRRFEIDVPIEYAHPVAWMMANALAIGAGYPYLGSPNKDRPFAPEVRGLPNGLLGEKL